MQFPTLSVPATSRDMISTFRGYNHTLQIGDGEFFDMTNMSSDAYPVLSPRRKRGDPTQSTGGQASGMISKDGFCYVYGRHFYINGYPIQLDLSDDGPKQLVSMGAYVIILPDKQYVNTLDLTDYGGIEATFCTSDATFQICDIDGAEYTDVVASAKAPNNPDNLTYWIDTSQKPNALKQYSVSNAAWIQVPTTYIKISKAGIGYSFQQYDSVTISGIKHKKLQDLNNTMTIWARDDNYIVVTGMIDTVIEETDSNIEISRNMPTMDFVTEAGNRLWGCRYGVSDNGEVVNEIYASKLGDFRNWSCFMGLSTDSYVATCGTDGNFTGAITHMGYPIFFKESCMHKVYGSYPANYQIETTACRGVQQGCGNSLAIVNEVLYYKSRDGICAYDGSLPVAVSSALGDVQYSNAAAGAIGNKYYISMMDAADAYHLFVYDTAKGLWHREDNTKLIAFCAHQNELYAIRDEEEMIALLGSGEPEQGPVPWMVETGILGTSMPDRKYISRINIRMSLEVGANVRVSIQYDSVGPWNQVLSMHGTSLRSISVPIRPRRCDHMRLRIAGEGDVQIYSITKTIEQGSELR